MLSNQKLISFLATTDPVKSKEFYEEKLGLALEEDDAFALVFVVAGTMLRIQKVDKHSPHAFTSLGWAVNDVALIVRELSRRGVSFQRYEGLEQDAGGVWTSPSGAKIAWFKDPDGNVLSLTEFSS